MVTEIGSMQASEHPLNSCAFDRSGDTIAAASDDGTVKIFDAKEGKWMVDLRGHDDAVQAVTFDPAGNYMVSAGSDNAFLMWR